MLRPKISIAIVLAALTLTAAAPANARMQSTKIASGLCLTVGGGRFVDIPGFPGELIDRRLLRDIRYLRRHYPIFITDGYSISDVHSHNGEHPLGLALDIVPDKAAGGTWAEIDALAAWAEPKQSQPIEPFRWVGYDGDANHGRGHHLHLSWSHAPAEFDEPAASVYTIRCPKPRTKRGDSNGGGGDGGGGNHDGPSGGTGAGKPKPNDPAGGVSPKLSPVVAERDGVDR